MFYDFKNTHLKVYASIWEVIKLFLLSDWGPLFVNRLCQPAHYPLSCGHKRTDEKTQKLKSSTWFHCSCPLCPLAIILWTRWSTESQLIQNLVSAVSISQLSDPAGPQPGPHFKTKISRFIATHYRQQPPGLVLIEVFGHQVWLASCNLYLQLAATLHLHSLKSFVDFVLTLQRRNVSGEFLKYNIGSWEVILSFKRTCRRIKI